MARISDRVTTTIVHIRPWRPLWHRPCTCRAEDTQTWDSRWRTINDLRGEWLWTASDSKSAHPLIISTFRYTIYPMEYVHTLVCFVWDKSYFSDSHGFSTHISWWHHKIDTFSALLALCVGNSSVTGEFPSQRPATRSFDVFFELCLNIRLSKQS